MLRRPLRYLYHRFLKPRYVRHRIRAARGSMRLDFYGPEIGFFAQLTACLHFFRHAEAMGFVPIIRLTSPNYLDSAMGGDWFDYHFLRLGQAAAGGRRPLRIGNISEMPEFPLCAVARRGACAVLPPCRDQAGGAAGGGGFRRRA